MKLLAFDRFPDQPLEKLPRVDLMVDSSVVLPGRPLFLPPVAEQYDIELLPAVKISRLGKNIAPKFARRYYDTFSLLVRVVPHGVGLSTSLLVAFDSSVAEGIFIPFPSDPVIEVALDGKYFTLKHGDIIAPCRLTTGLTAMIDTRLTASVNGEAVVDLKIK